MRKEAKSFTSLTGLIAHRPCMYGQVLYSSYKPITNFSSKGSDASPFYDGRFKTKSYPKPDQNRPICAKIHTDSLDLWNHLNLIYLKSFTRIFIQILLFRPAMDKLCPNRLGKTQYLLSLSSNSPPS